MTARARTEQCIYNPIGAGQLFHQSFDADDRNSCGLKNGVIRSRVTLPLAWFCREHHANRMSSRVKMSRNDKSVSPVVPFATHDDDLANDAKLAKLVGAAAA